MSDVPAGFRWRRPTMADAEAILDVIAWRNTPLVGSPDFTLVEVRDFLSHPGLDLSTSAWFVEGPDGSSVGFGWAHGKGTSDIVDIEVLAHDDVADWLWERVLERAREIGSAAGHAEINVDVDVYQNDEALRARAGARGFVPATTFQRMRIDFDDAPTVPAVPSGVVVRTGPGDERLRRDAHDVWRAAFGEHFGFVEKSFEDWHLGIESAETSDWAQLHVAYVDGAPAGMLRGSNDFVEDEDCGYVATVAVVPRARGRGLAKLLLRQAFVDDFRRGRRGTVLHVDSNNVTPAVDLYVSVGMRPVLAIDVWRGRLATTIGREVAGD
jgi:ribosomal protein S18 acetylase RimI-like enzyme